jgi:hypothetical protein
MKIGDVDEFPDNIFRNVFQQDLLDITAGVSPPPLILIISNVRDLVSDHTVYPQRALRQDLVDATVRIFF